MANPEASKPPAPGPDEAATERRADETARKDGAGDPPPPPFLEVTCRSSGEVRRFAAGTTARYALHAVNRKLAPGSPAALHVEAAKEGEEPVCFGPTAPLADYGRGWRLQTVTEQDAHHHVPPPPPPGGEGKGARERELLRKKGASVYLAKIGLAFVFLFLLGGLFTYLLETIPDMILASTPPQSM
ncbi:uncharacterized protein LOC123452227 [Hordeum vulgare subsp. vulgare]|uniref:Uncharacterized protein n=1 Tax=Hordeum vulgare subsp. vulgare TaxID=112509 RepID=A0A8I6YCB7_HORVV|nr:uncharacterized protein LOC123452227 [Hordeum vulgare subsp. vulgare]KAI4965255.1 hypothetical protein ZWY2020_054942 [Hordeum vulgare]